MDLTPEYVRGLIPARPEDGHKGTFGRVLILAGARGYTGAAKLSSMGALRSGAGLVTVGIPDVVGDVVAAGLMEAMPLYLPSSDQGSFSREAVAPALEFAQGMDAVVLGCGLSQTADAAAFVRGIVAGCPCPLLIDADGLNNLGPWPDELRDAPSPCVITPHPGEMARLTGMSSADVQESREATAQQVADKLGCTVVLKGQGTVIAQEKGSRYTNRTGNSGMATGGTGDVLAGLIGGLMAHKLPILEAALLGVFLHGLAGDIAAAAKTPQALIARDLIDALPNAWRGLQEGDGSACER